MNAIATPTLSKDNGPLSPWWIRSFVIVMVVGFIFLLTITILAYHDAPPIPAKIVDASGNTLFTGDDIRAGQAVFLKYGLMNNGSIWGHGAYLGPDYSAVALHRIGEDTARALAQHHYGKNLAQLTPFERAAVQAKTAAILKINLYDAATDTLRFTPIEATAYRQQIKYWTNYFKRSSDNGGLKPNAIANPIELRQFTAFVTWAAWASVANRPGANFSYTNNFPYNPSVGNRPTSGALLWSALSLVVLLGGNRCGITHVRQIRLSRLDESRAARTSAGTTRPCQRWPTRAGEVFRCSGDFISDANAGGRRHRPFPGRAG